MLWYKKRDYSDKYFTFIGNQEDKMHYPIEAINFSIHNWKDMEWEYLCSYYQAWRSYDYEVKNGKAHVIYEMMSSTRHTWVEFACAILNYLICNCNMK